MRLNSVFILGVLFTLVFKYGHAQDSTDKNLRFSVAFSNEFLLSGKGGELIIVCQEDSSDQVVVRWKNGYLSTGALKNGIPWGEWNIYDCQNRLREVLLFGPEAECILYSKKLNKKGMVTSEFKSLTPCF